MTYRIILCPISLRHVIGNARLYIETFPVEIIISVLSYGTDGTLFRHVVACDLIPSRIQHYMQRMHIFDHF